MTNFQVSVSVGGQFDADVQQALVYSSPPMVAQLAIPVDFSQPANMVQAACVGADNALAM